MAAKNDDGLGLEGDADFLDGIEHLDELKEPVVEDNEDFDFDGHDVPLDSIPSWTEELPEAARNAPREQPVTEMPLDEGFTLDIGEDELEARMPDTAEIFAPETSFADVSEIEEQRDAYLSALRQLQADFENYKKRVIRDNQDYADVKSVKLMEELLPVIDNFELALKTIVGKDAESKKLRKGIELVYNDLFSVLERQGLEVIDAEGALFDPEFHDAVAHEDNGEHEHEIVVEVLRPGYKVRGRVVRPAMVRVAQ